MTSVWWEASVTLNDANRGATGGSLKCPRIWSDTKFNSPNSVIKNICLYSKRSQTCHHLCERQGCYHSASKTHVETGSLDWAQFMLQRFSDSLNVLHCRNQSWTKLNSVWLRCNAARSNKLTKVAGAPAVPAFSYCSQSHKFIISIVVVTSHHLRQYCRSGNPCRTGGRLGCTKLWYFEKHCRRYGFYCQISCYFCCLCNFWFFFQQITSNFFLNH